MTTPIKDQISATDRIRCDLLKESAKHRNDGRGSAADDCKAQADTLYDVIETLKLTLRMSEALGGFQLISTV